MNTQKGYTLAKSELEFIGETVQWVAAAAVVTALIAIVTHGNWGIYTPIALAAVPILQGFVLKFDGKVPTTPPTV